MGVLCNCLLGALPYALRDTIISLVRSKSSPPHTNYRTRPPAVIDRQKKTITWWSVSCSERHVLQCRCQPTLTQPIYNIGGGTTGGTAYSDRLCQRLTATRAGRYPIALQVLNLCAMSFCELPLHRIVFTVNHWPSATCPSSLPYSFASIELARLFVFANSAAIEENGALLRTTGGALPLP